MITHDDRKAAHLAAGLWLEAHASPPVPAELVEHFEQGGVGEKAAFWCCAAARDAMAVADVNQAVSLSERGLANGAQGETRGLLRMLQADALTWRGDFEQAQACFKEAFAYLDENKRSAGYLPFTMCLINLAKYQEAVSFALSLASDPGAETSPNAQKAFAAAVTSCTSLGDQTSMAIFLLRRHAEPDESTMGHWCLSDCMRLRSLGDPFEAFTAAKKAKTAFRLAGDLKFELNAEVEKATTVFDLGGLEEAEEGFDDARLRLHSLGLFSLSHVVETNLLMLYVRRGRFERCLSDGVRIIGEARERKALGNIYYCLAAMALAHLALGDLVNAKTTSIESLSIAQGNTSLVPLSASVQAKVYLASRHFEAALRSAEIAIEIVHRGLPIPDGEMLARSTYVDCLLAVDRRADAAVAARDNALRLAHLTIKITAPKYQLTYLHNIPENRDVVRQARELGTDLNTPELSVLLC